MTATWLFTVINQYPFFASILLLCTTGCSDQLATYPVSGRVQFKNGSPVHVGTVELKSVDHLVQARGEIQNDGTFTLTTYEPGDGAVAGKHQCVVVQMILTEGVANHRPSRAGVVDRRFGSYQTSGLEVEIKPGDENQVVIEVDGLKNAPSTENHDH